MRVLVGFEQSGTVRDAFSRHGADAWSCDIAPSAAPGNHIQGDIRLALEQQWDLAIFHPPCTYLCRAGIHWNSRRPERAAKTAEALDLVRLLLSLDIPRIALENPIGVISTNVRKPDQVVHPWQFGHDAEKTTLLWLKNLPLLPLDPGKVLLGRQVEWPVGSGKLKSRWANQTDSGNNALPPSKDRWMLRSKTYPGIAEAMAKTWVRALHESPSNT